MKLNKKILGIICGVLALVVIASFTMKTSTATDKLSKIKDQTVDGVNFKNAKVNKKDDAYTFNVDLYNENTEKVEIKKLTITFKKDGKDVKVTLDDVSSMEPFTGRKIEIKTREELSNITGVEYKIN